MTGSGASTRKSAQANVFEIKHSVLCDRLVGIYRFGRNTFPHVILSEVEGYLSAAFRRWNLCHGGKFEQVQSLEVILRLRSG